MKVIQLLPELNSGGVERGTLEVADFLVKRGHEAVVISNGGRLVADLEKLGARHIAMPVHRKSWRSLLEVKKLREVFEREGADVVHIRSRVPGWIAWLAWRKMDPATRPRLVSTVHGFYSVNAYSKVMTRGERVIAVSESIRGYILKNYPGTDEGKIRVIHRGASPEYFPKGFVPDTEWMGKWESEHPGLVGKTLLLMPGRITRWKGQEDFLRVVAGLKKAGREVHGLVAGEVKKGKEAYGEELNALARELGVAEDVTFLGHRSDLRELMAISSLVYSLSSAPEAFGRVSLEAMALGIPVVAYDHGGVGEQLAEIFPEGRVRVADLEGVITCSEKVLEEGLKPGEIGGFTLEKMLEATLGVYEDLHADE